jgi:peptide/nickel transport system substrate-binding protein
VVLGEGISALLATSVLEAASRLPSIPANQAGVDGPTDPAGWRTAKQRPHFTLATAFVHGQHQYEEGVTAVHTRFRAIRSLKFKAIATSAGLITAASLLLTGGMATVASAATPPTFYSDWGWVQGASFNWYNNNGLPMPGVDVEPLAFPLLSPTSFQPALAQSWKLSPNGRTLTVTLRSNAKFSNGQPVTAADVKAAWASMFIEGWVSSYDTEQVNVLNSHTIQFVRFPSPDVLWEQQVLEQDIAAPQPFEQAHLLPSNIWTVIQKSLYTGTNKAELAAAKSAQSEMSKLAVKTSALPVKTDISDGPWTLKSINTEEEVWVRNPYFFNNTENHISTLVEYQALTAQAVYNLAVGNRMTAFTGALPPNVVAATMRNPGEHTTLLPRAEFAGIQFNEHDYPYNLLQVRQAFAYLINRTNVQKIAEPISGTPVKYVTGMDDPQAEQWLPKSVLNSLNPYTYSPAKATALLKSAGFKKVGGTWQMPNGKPFDVSIQVEAGYPDYDEAASVIQTAFNNFGIPTKVFQDNLTEYATNQNAGDYAVSFNSMGGGNVTYPQAAYNQIYWVNDGWTAKGTTPVRLSMGKAGAFSAPRAFDVPNSIKVPGTGTVSPGVLTYRLTQVPSHAAQVADFTKLAEATNYWMPVIPLFNQSSPFFWNTTNWTDFPPIGSFWLSVDSIYQNELLWAQYGWIKPK